MLTSQNVTSIRHPRPLEPPSEDEHDRTLYKKRHRIERLLGQLKQQRRSATDYDKTALSFESFLNLAAAQLWLQSFIDVA